MLNKPLSFNQGDDFQSQPLAKVKSKQTFFFCHSMKIAQKLPILLGRVPLNAKHFHFVCVSCYQVAGNASVPLENNLEVLVPSRGVGGFCDGFL